MVFDMNIVFDYTFQIVALGSGMMGLSSGVLGSFAVLKKRGLMGDGISHSVLPGVVMAFILTGSKSSEVLLLGASISGVMATIIIMSIVKNSVIKFDSALAIVLSVFFGMGLVLLTYTQKLENSNQAGIKSFIYGQASTLLARDVYLICAFSALIIFSVIIFWKELKVFSFDEEFSFTIGFSGKWINLLLSLLMVISIVIGIQTVGVILMSSILIAPAVSARQWTDRLSVMVVLSGIFGMISGILGTYISSLESNLPTGPLIVIVATLISIFSLVFSPRRGIISKIRNRKSVEDLYKRRCQR